MPGPTMAVYAGSKKPAKKAKPSKPKPKGK
jgi:hypothetical protein